MPGILEPFNHIAWSKMYASFPCIDLGEGVHCVDPDGLEQTFTIKLEDILAFVTGAPSEPPMGFHPQPAINFQRTSPYPRASTCSNVLFLPLREMDYNEFTYRMCFGILSSAGFGRV